MEVYDLIIVGGGPAGATAALYAQRQGLTTLLLDKARFPRDKICGDALSGKTVAILHELDLLEEVANLPGAAISRIVFGSPDVRGKKVAVQGCGHVGYYLAGYLAEAGAQLYYTDINGSKVRRCVDEFGGEAVEGEAFYGLDVDVLAPCAIGGIINHATIPHLKAPIIAGGANNVLDDEVRDGEALEERGITYAPDYVINAGGLINVYAELKQLPRQKAMDDAAAIFSTVKSVINSAKAEGIATIDAANKLAEQRIATVNAIQRMHIPRS